VINKLDWHFYIRPHAAFARDDGETCAVFVYADTSHLRDWKTRRVSLLPTPTCPPQ